MAANCLPVSSCGVKQEFRDALMDAQAMTNEYGNPIIINLRDEADVTRDSYNSIKSRPTASVRLAIKAATISYQPTKKALEKAGLREDCECAIKVAVKDFMDAGLTFDDLEMSRTTVVVKAVIPGEASGTTYVLKEKARTGEFANGYLYFSLGLVKR